MQPARSVAALAGRAESFRRRVLAQWHARRLHTTPQRSPSGIDGKATSAAAAAAAVAAAVAAGTVIVLSGGGGLAVHAAAAADRDNQRNDSKQGGRGGAVADATSRTAGVAAPHSSSSSWWRWLPSSAQPSDRPAPSNRSNVDPPSASSGEAALASLTTDAGMEHAQPGDKSLMSLPSSSIQHLAHAEVSSLPVEDAVLTQAPRCPPPITRTHPVLLRVALDTTSKVMQLTNRLKYQFWTFNDLCPGPVIRARVGDVVELTLRNRDQTGNPHNIDCHGFDGPGGGSSITTAQQDEQKVARFKLLHPGLFLYHCAAAPVPAHIFNGMYGMMLVESDVSPLPPADREFAVVQSEFYIEPLDNTGGNTVVEPSYPRGLDETADVVVFNGKESSLTLDAPLQCRTGERVRIYFANAGPNLASAFHVIGMVFDSVWRDADVVSPPGRFIQTALVPPGGATIVDVCPVVPGTYTLLDHAIFRLDKGCVGYLNARGPNRPDIYSGGDPQPCPGCKLHP